MSSPFIAVATFLTEALFDFYIGLILLRFFLQWVKADFHNPICQFVTKMTNPLVLPMRKIIPGFFGVDCAALSLAILGTALQLALLSLMTGALSPSLFIWVVILKLIAQILNLYFFIVIIRALLGFGSQPQANPLYLAAYALSEPLLKPIRAVIPLVSGFDLSPLIVLVIIQALLILLRYLA